MANFISTHSVHLFSIFDAFVELVVFTELAVLAAVLTEFAHIIEFAGFTLIFRPSITASATLAIAVGVTAATIAPEHFAPVDCPYLLRCVILQHREVGELPS